MDEIKIKNIIIGKQFEESENYKKFIETVKNKKIKVNVVEAGKRINIEKNLYFDVLWPSSDNVIWTNSINNNSLVCKMNYKKFSILFAGDIEKVAENAILAKYGSYINNKTISENSSDINEKRKLNNYDINIMQSTILKVAHHGSKTSSITNFLNLVKPQYALIGVGKNNKFGHPADITLQNLENIGTKVFRTDLCGEITVKTSGIKIGIKSKMIQ